MGSRSITHSFIHSFTATLGKRALEPPATDLKRPKADVAPRKTGVAIVWFRADLRLMDNPALAHAAAEYTATVPLYVWAPEEEGEWGPRGMSEQPTLLKSPPVAFCLGSQRLPVHRQIVNGSSSCGPNSVAAVPHPPWPPSGATASQGRAAVGCLGLQGGVGGLSGMGSTQRSHSNARQADPAGPGWVMQLDKEPLEAASKNIRAAFLSERVHIARAIQCHAAEWGCDEKICYNGPQRLHILPISSHL